MTVYELRYAPPVRLLCFSFEPMPLCPRMSTEGREYHGDTSGNYSIVAPEGSRWAFEGGRLVLDWPRGRERRTSDAKQAFLFAREEMHGFRFADEE